MLNIFLKLQDKKQHLAIITEEEKQINGIITIEDIFEEIVGDIYDEVEDSQTLKYLLSRNKFPIKKYEKN